jgi:hypothetical protein
MTNHGFGGSLQVFGALVDSRNLSSLLFPLGVSQILINEPGICVYSSFGSSSCTGHAWYSVSVVAEVGISDRQGLLTKFRTAAHSPVNPLPRP